MEPRTAMGVWEPPKLTLYDSTQSVHSACAALAKGLGFDIEHVWIVLLHGEGGFGSKGEPHARNVLATLAAMQAPGRPLKPALTR